MIDLELNNDPTAELLECIFEIVVSSLPPEKQKEIRELADLRSELTEIVIRMKRIPLEKVNRFNELRDKHFSEGDSEA